MRPDPSPRQVTAGGSPLLRYKSHFSHVGLIKNKYSSQHLWDVILFLSQNETYFYTCMALILDIVTGLVIGVSQFPEEMMDRSVAQRKN